MVPKMHPRSSKMLPRRPTGIRGNHFFHPWGSKVTSWVPKVSPGVPKWALQALPRPQTKTPFGYQSLSWGPFAPPACCFCCPLGVLFCVLLPPRPLDPTTHRRIHPASHRRHFAITPGRQNARSDPPPPGRRARSPRVFYCYALIKSPHCPTHSAGPPPCLFLF